ncbi:MAG: hypothetical protein QOC90_107 [Mycobacterium sp.]|nr:hypothetical protein [Mycobacterium sp.]
MHPGRSHTRCPFVSVSGLVILLLAESPTLTVISAVVTAASGAGTIGLVLRLVRRGVGAIRRDDPCRSRSSRYQGSLKLSDRQVAVRN